VICSHVLEHAANPEAFLGELGRVAGRGYLEFPTVNYDYLYNFKEHVSLLLHKDGEILWMPKDQTTLNKFSGIQEFLRATLHSGYHELVQSMQDDFFQGFEWIAPITVRKVENLNELVPSNGIPALKTDRYPPPSGRELARELVRRVGRRINRAAK
jgi:hypothetical protein